MTRVPAYVSPPPLFLFLHLIRFSGHRHINLRSKLIVLTHVLLGLCALLFDFSSYQCDFVVACRGARNALVCYRFLSFNLDF